MSDLPIIDPPKLPDELPGGIAKPPGTVLYEYKVIGGEWHKMEGEVASYLNNGTGWVLQGGVMFVEYHKSQNTAYAAQAIYREIPLTKEEA